MHKELAFEGINILKENPEISLIILYGSVARGDFNRKSDIDLALICDDFFKFFPLGLDGFPYGLRDRIKNSLQPLTQRAGILFHTPLYWMSEFEKGILFFSKNTQSPVFLQEVGKIVYDGSSEQKISF